MEGIGPGSVLGDRYAAATLIHGAAGSTGESVAADAAEAARSAGGFERWHAHDLTLEREVVLLCFDSGDPQAAATLDAARRAAGVEDRRLARVLDVGSSGPIAWVVEEPLTGFAALDQLLDGGGLDAGEARRIAGETATALATAGARGLHHQVLTPAHVLRSAEGSVKVRGLATEAALGGIEIDDPRVALRTDATAIAGIAYAALTGRWPNPTANPTVGGAAVGFADRPGPEHGLLDAPTIGEGIAPASELAAGVPEDLDRLLTRTLRGHTGPAGPAEMAAALAPWTRSRSTVAPRTARTASATANTRGGQAPAPSGPPGEASRRPSGGQAGGRPPHTGRPTTRPGIGGPPGRRRTPEQVTVGLDDLYGPIAPAPPRPRVALPERVVDAVAEQPSSGQSRLALVIVGVFVLVAAIVGYLALPRLGSTPNTGPATTSTGLATLGPKSTPSGQADQAGSTPPPTTAAAAPLTPIPVVSANGFDPQGDGIEGNNIAKYVIDGDPNTLWRSQWYTSDKFGGLPKQGVGVILDLGKPTAIHQVDVILPAGQDISVYAAPGASLDGATPIGAPQINEPGTISVATANGTPVTGQYVILWVTKLIPDEGKWRASIAEAQIR